MHFFERICGGGKQEYVTEGESLILEESGGSYEWLRDVEMEDVEDSKDAEAPLPAEYSINLYWHDRQFLEILVTVRQSLEFKRGEGTSRNHFATKFAV